MRVALTRVAAIGMAALALACAGCGNGGPAAGDPAGTAGSGTPAQPRELTVAIAGMVTPEEGLAYYQDLSRYVGDQVGLPVRLFHKAEYAEVNDMLEKRKVDVAFVCSGPYVSGHDKFGLELLAAPVVGGKPVYYSYLIVPETSQVTSLEGLRGKTFAFTDPQSNTGRMVPIYQLAKIGETPEQFFGKTYFTYSHDNSIKAVATGEADGAAVDSLIWDYANANAPVYTSKTKVILKSDPFGIPPVVVHPDMDVALKRKLRDAFVRANDDPKARPILAKMGIERFTVVRDSDYDSIRRMNEWVAAQKQ